MDLLFKLKSMVLPPLFRVYYFRTAPLCVYLYVEGTLYVSTLRFSDLTRTRIHLLKK